MHLLELPDLGNYNDFLLTGKGKKGEKSPATAGIKPMTWSVVLLYHFATTTALLFFKKFVCYPTISNMTLAIEQNRSSIQES